MARRRFVLARWITALLSLCLIAIATRGTEVLAATSTSGEKQQLDLRPGESGSLVIDLPVNPSGDPAQAVKLIITASNTPNGRASHLNTASSSTTDGAQVAASSSSCGGVEKAVNATGGTMYQWQAIASYDYNGATVDVWGHSGTPYSNYGWYFDHENWVIAGNNTSIASASSTGYFTYQFGGRQYARVSFTIRGNGTCSVSGSTGSW